MSIYNCRERSSTFAHDHPLVPDSSVCYQTISVAAIMAAAAATDSVRMSINGGFAEYGVGQPLLAGKGHATALESMIVGGDGSSTTFEHFPGDYNPETATVCNLMTPTLVCNNCHCML